MSPSTKPGIVAEPSGRAEAVSRAAAASASKSVIHIGLHKVASTTLQHSLHALRDELAAQAFLYPVDILPHRAQHSDLAMFLRDGNHDEYRTAMDTILRDFRKLENGNLLLSGEGLSSLSTRHIELLHRDLVKTGRQFRIVLYVRNLYRIAISTIAERSKSGKFIAYPSRVIGRRSVNPSAMLSKWEKVFGDENVTAACLEALPAEANIVTHFAALAGLRLPADFQVSRRNRSIDPIASALLSHLAYEFQVSHHLYYRSYFENIPDTISLPRTEDHLLQMADDWVAGVDLSHPKLSPFRDLLCERPVVLDEVRTVAESGADYLRLLGKVLLRTAELGKTDAPPKRKLRRKQQQMDADGGFNGKSPGGSPARLLIGPDIEANEHLVRLEHCFGPIIRDNAKIAEDVSFVFLCFINRSGSNYLAELIASDSRYNLAGELLNWDAVLATSRRTGARRFQDCFAQLAATESRSGHFFVKAALQNVDVLVRSGVLDQIIDRSRFIMLERNDALAQAISFALAFSTRAYSSRAKTSRQPHEVEYSFESIEHYLRTIAMAYRQFALFFGHNGIVPVRVVYERLIADPAGEASWLGRELGLPGLVIDPSKVRLERQAGQVNEDWRRRFLAERGQR